MMSTSYEFCRLQYRVHKWLSCISTRHATEDTTYHNAFHNITNDALNQDKVGVNHSQDKVSDHLQHLTVYP